MSMEKRNWVNIFLVSRNIIDYLFSSYIKYLYHSIFIGSPGRSYDLRVITGKFTTEKPQTRPIFVIDFLGVIVEIVEVRVFSLMDIENWNEGIQRTVNKKFPWRAEITVSDCPGNISWYEHFSSLEFTVYWAVHMQCFLQKNKDHSCYKKKYP